MSQTESTADSPGTGVQPAERFAAAQRYFAGDPRSNRERMLARDWYVANDPDNARIAARARLELGRYERAFAEGEPDARAHLRAAMAASGGAGGRRRRRATVTSTGGRRAFGR